MNYSDRLVLNKANSKRLTETLLKGGHVVQIFGNVQIFIVRLILIYGWSQSFKAEGLQPVMR